MKLLILGGYGVFGGRLVELLRDTPLEILVAGRSLEKAGAFCERTKSRASLVPVAVERARIAEALTAHRPDIVIDASGPFQNYGDNPYAVVQAAIAAGVNYLDFADGADFVFGIDRFDGPAREAGVFVLSGISSFPVLTAAVLRRIEKEMTIESVTGGIAPSPFAGVGLNVMRAVLSYAGKPVRLWRGGAAATAPGLAEVRRYTIAPPGKMPLRHLRFSLVEVPDLQVIPPEHPGLRDIWMGAGPVPEILHRILILLARARAGGLFPSLAPAAPLFYRVLNLMRFGEHRGGMFVDVRGHAKGGPREMSWHLLAEGDDGPMIPSMAIEAVVRKVMAGDPPKPGARAGTRALELEDYEALFRDRSIVTGFRRDTGAAAPLYPALLGDSFAALPGPVQALHGTSDPRTWRGEAAVTPGRHAIQRLAARVFGFPTRPGGVPVEVRFEPTGKGELWTRNFGGQVLKSEQAKGRGVEDRLLVERFGPVFVALALVVDGDTLRLVPRSWRFLGIPLPKALLPRGDSHETAEGDRFRFHVEVDVPLLGRVVAYRGWLEPASD